MIAVAGVVSGQFINTGSGAEASIAPSIEIIQTVIGNVLRFTREERQLSPAVSEVYRVVCDSIESQNLTGFASEVGLEEDLAWTVEWFSIAETERRYSRPGYPIEQPLSA